ncbi:ATP-dependent helicase HrpB [Rheinheimera sp. UJ51]|uniref:ATP-dependent helicase HrpB n=1 Tax=Rheinheimera sp. UJ51 TaxID=2892446 RepID=UPI001E64C249|nr:ATP-dependent helicase HrpB [Rheinheimera sp. UJ51]MCC5451391.1 ATP-dependent helicase HrpB [Rheinheimera sp. UJ51]
MLPVNEIMPRLCQLLQHEPKVILSAPPGAGKSTFLPLYLLKHPAFAGKRLLLLEPRRLAARTIASYLAAQLNEPVGQTVGYQIRQDSQYCAETRLLIVTEGILTRKIQQDPELSSVDILIFDEFHERSLHADFGLALALEVQQLNEQLRILVMSATLDTSMLARYLQAPVLQSEGRSYPVNIVYQPLNKEPIALQSARLALQGFWRHQSSVLVFLPGQAEINQAAQWLAQQDLAANLRVLPLLGSMSLAAQQAAIAAPAAGQYKIVLATNLAETSLTIEGIHVVVDSGVARRASYHARSGLTRLDTVAISQAAATQRAGRAGRLGEGWCYRLDSAEQWQRRTAFEPAEIEISELTSLRLEIAVWGCQPADLNWLTAPQSANLAAATALLQQLEVLDQRGQITAYGQTLYQFGTDIRLASMLQHAKTLETNQPGALWLAALLAALLEDSRDLHEDLYRQVQRLAERPAQEQRRYQQAEVFAKRLAAKKYTSLPLGLLPVLLLRAFPDRLAQRRGQGYLLANGVGASFPANHPLQQQDLVVAVSITQTAQSNRIQQAVAIALPDILDDWPALAWQPHTGWDEKQAGFYSESQRLFGEIVLQRRPQPLQLTAAEKQQAWLAYLAKKGIAILPFNARCQQLQQRVALLTQHQYAGLPDLSLSGLTTNMASWLGPYLANINKVNQLAQLPLYDLLWQQLSYSQQQQLNQCLPEFFTTPAHSRVAIDYCLPGGPGFSVRVQEMYGQLTTPQVLDGKLALSVTLLSPGRQPLQITRDLASFWQQGWHEVKKEMKGRYPKHFWPDDPAKALPTTKTKKAMRYDSNS